MNTEIPARPDITLNHLNILVSNLDVSWPFYHDILGFQYVYHLAPRKIVADCHGFEVFLEEHENAAKCDPRFHFGLRTTADAVFAWAARLAAHRIPLVKGNNPSAEVYKDPDCNRVALYFCDPDGLTIEIYSPE